jgi:hypothetical protein
MPRQRIINPEFWLDYEIASIENPNACLFYIGTWNFSDDYGVVENNPHKLKAQIFPYRDVDVAELIDIFVKIGKFVPFEAEGKKWLLLKNFKKYQYVQKPSKFRNPEPPKEVLPDYYHTAIIPLPSEEKRRETVTKTEREEKERGLGETPSTPKVREGAGTRQRAFSSPNRSGNAAGVGTGMASARKGKPFYWDQQMRHAQGKWWVLPKEGGRWKEFAGKESEIIWK